MSDKDEIKLGRVGHYRGQDTNEQCWEARIVKVWNESMINLAGDDQGGNHFSRTSVKVGALGATDFAAFHLNRDCPDKL